MFEIHQLQHIPANLLEPAPIDHRYDDSPFCILKALPIKTKGDRMEGIVAFLATISGVAVTPRYHSDHDFLMGGYAVEVKGATLGLGTTHFTFNQIRPPQDYEILMFAMFYPHHLILMEMPKQMVVELVKKKIFKAQHGGKNGKSGTFSYTGDEQSLASIGAVEVPWSQGAEPIDYNLGTYGTSISVPLY